MASPSAHTLAARPGAACPRQVSKPWRGGGGTVHRGPAPKPQWTGARTPHSPSLIALLGLKGSKSCMEELNPDPNTHTQNPNKAELRAPGWRPRPAPQASEQPGRSQGGPGARGWGGPWGRSPGPARSPFSSPWDSKAHHGSSPSRTHTDQAGLTPLQEEGNTRGSPTEGRAGPWLCPGRGAGRGRGSGRAGHRGPGPAGPFRPRRG